ncbi:5,6-dimethylbenzimidazole synthase [Leucothrix arctica]|uniref:5,6-dimethylbenzimidazole synthase n=1 Tax=Leucothrix arctica TaxID=1481894 RepID=A0A317CLJ9_9GAMM|nr:5,6-dimethylbenzimidazole synthase [Leucothrix arctica]PWQ98323.1 5,6-dimethylbenzimidazole synthase [Leucothrix arctica]
MKNKQFTVDDQAILEEIMLYRRDVRGNKFLSTPVPQEAIQKILMAASLAPSVGFSQPWEFLVIRNEETKNKVVESFETENQKANVLFEGKKKSLYSQLKLEGIREAPVNIAVYYTSSKKPVLGQTSMKEAGEYSVVCAIQNMWLMARAMNIGLGWVSIIDPEVVKGILKSSPDSKLIAYLCIGYVDEFLESPELEMLEWEKRKELQSVVHYDD